MRRRKRRICFVTGTRADFGLMEPVLRAIQSHPKLELQIIATGMHLDPECGATVNSIHQDGWKIDRTVRWEASRRRKRPRGDLRKSSAGVFATAQRTGAAISGITIALEDLKSDIVLLVGDRVEAFAAATAGHISGRVVAHVHGGDRALGQIDDSLRHAITKLAHLHFAATKQSAMRILKLGEDRWRNHLAGSPGIDQITRVATCNALSRHRFALLVLHPVDADERMEHQRASLVLRAVTRVGFDRIVIIHPNNDPGSKGIARCWNENATTDRFIVYRNVSRPHFLGLLRDAAVLVGNSSSGIIEAASFGTPAIDIGPRQLGRERSANARHVSYRHAEIHGAIEKVWNKGRPKRFAGKNVYEGGASKIIPRILSSVRIDDRLLRKLIAY
jgi:GDP/UDP-N,N'-diacetylbacillosamine 2-epimerase (hydrolysing)